MARELAALLAASALLLSACITNSDLLHQYDINHSDAREDLSMPPGLKLEQQQRYQLPKSVLNHTTHSSPASTEHNTATTLDPTVNYHIQVNQPMEKVWATLPEAIAAANYRLLQTSKALHTFYVANPNSKHPQNKLLQIQTEENEQGVSLLVLNNRNQPVPSEEIQAILAYLESHR